MRFRLRTLFTAVTLAAILTLPISNMYVHLQGKWSPRNSSGLVIELPEFDTTVVSTVVTVPDRGTVLKCGKLPN